MCSGVCLWADDPLVTTTAQTFFCWSNALVPLRMMMGRLQWGPPPDERDYADEKLCRGCESKGKVAFPKQLQLHFAQVLPLDNITQQNIWNTMNSLRSHHECSAHPHSVPGYTAVFVLCTV